MKQEAQSRRERRQRVNAPWSSKGWYGDEMRGARDPELDRLIQAEGRGKINPLGYYQDRPIFAVSPAMHNPYLNLVSGALTVWVGTFLFNETLPSLLGAFALGGFFWFLGAGIIFFTVIRIPSWHRARQVAKEYLRTHEGELPPELRLYN